MVRPYYSARGPSLAQLYLSPLTDNGQTILWHWRTPLALLYFCFQLQFSTLPAMVTRQQTDKATLLHVFKEILGFEEDSDPSKALAQEGYTDMQGFLSIGDDEFAGFVVKEIVGRLLEGKSARSLWTSNF